MPREDPLFSDVELGRRWTALRTRMAARGVDSVLVYGAGRNMDIQYLTDWPGTREAYLVIPGSGEPTLLIQFNNHVPNARRVAAVADVRWAGDGSIDRVVAALTAQEATRIGLVGAVPWRLASALARHVPRTEIVDFTFELRMLRAIASDAEIALLRSAARMTDTAMRALEAETRPGMRERDLAHLVERAIVDVGGTPGIHFMATTPMRAPRIGVPSQLQSDRVIQSGDILITEISAHDHGYGGQIHRAYAIGAEPTPEFERLHDVASETYRSIASALRDGTTVAAILDAADVVHRRGCTLYDDLLHGTDQLPPVLQTRKTARGPLPESFVFRENMILVIQPNVVSDDSGAAGLQVGETVRVTREGVERLHEYPLAFVRCR